MALYSAHQRRLYLYTLTLLPAPPDAEDVFQDANVVLWQKFDQYQPDTNFFAWACKIIRYKVLQHRDKASRVLKVLSPEVLESLADDAVTQVDRADNIFSGSLDDCMDRLSASDQEMIRRRYTSGMAVQAIAAALRRSPNAVSQSLVRIRRLLLDCINGAVNEPNGSGGKL